MSAPLKFVIPRRKPTPADAADVAKLGGELLEGSGFEDDEPEPTDSANSDGKPR